MDRMKIGSETAKNGFKNEQFVVDVFNNWQSENLAKLWLEAMGYKINEIESVKAEKIKGSFKADVQVCINVQIKLKRLQDIQNIQVKLVSQNQGFNQIDKRWLKTYDEMWNFPKVVREVLEFYVGERAPKIKKPKDKRRMFLNEFTQREQNAVLEFFNKNSVLIVSDILRGRGQFTAEWYLVIIKDTTNPTWVLKSINEVMNFYSGIATISSLGNLHLGKITIQRKGGDGGRDSAKMLQFKIDPTLLFGELKC